MITAVPSITGDSAGPGRSTKCSDPAGGISVRHETPSDGLPRRRRAISAFGNPSAAGNTILARCAAPATYRRRPQQRCHPQLITWTQHQ